MVKAYKRFNRPVKAIAFVHGNEALWWYQRIFPDRFSGFVRILKFIKYVILNSYNMIYMRNKLNKLDISLVFVSDWMKKQTIKNWNLKSNSNYYIIPNIVNNLIFPYREKSNEKKYNFLMIRQFTSGKYALDVAMDIIKELQAYPENDKFKFTIIGDGWLFEKYTSRVSMFSNVEIKRTFLSQNDISKYHNENGFFICPTRQDAQGVSMCEAMSSGLIPISSNNTAIPEFLPEKYNLCFDNAKDSAKRIIETIKMCPLVNELKTRENLGTIVCVTGQHRQMLDQVLQAFNVKPDYDLSIMKDRQTLFDVTTNILNRIKEVLEEVKPDVVLVHGDTSTTFVTALACFYLQIPVGHVEAGLRTYDIYSPYPEEFNRQAVSIISKYNFAPTELSKENLIKEGKKPESIYVTGNTAIDALKTTVKDDYTNEHLEWAKDSRLIMITAHRRENLGEPMTHMFRAIRRVMDEHPDVKAIYPIHMNPAVRERAEKELSGCNRIRIIEPLEVLDFHNFLARSYMILTDSGGIQEEAPSLGKPVLVMRDTTERPEGIKAGTLKLVGTDEEVIYNNFSKLLSDKNEYEKMSHASNPYGDGTACKQIANILEESN